MKKQESSKKIKALEEEIKKLKKEAKRQRWWDVWFAWKD